MEFSRWVAAAGVVKINVVCRGVHEVPFYRIGLSSEVIVCASGQNLEIISVS